MDLSGIINVLLKKWWLLILVPLACGVLTFLVVNQQKNSYKSSAQLSTGFTVENNLALQDEKLDFRKINVQFDNFIETMKSDRVISLLSYRLAMRDLNSETKYRQPREGAEVRIEKEKTLEILKKHYDSLKILDVYDDEENQVFEWLKARDYHPWGLKRDLSVKRVNNTDFIKVDFISHNPFLSAYVVNTLCEEMIRYYNEINLSRSNESVQFFTTLVEEKKKILDEKTERLNQFKSSNSVTDYKIQSESLMTQISDYEIKKQDELKNIQGLELSIDKLERDIRGKAEGNTVDNSNIIRLRNKINELNEIYVAGGLKDEELKGRIDELRRKLRTEMSQLSSSSGSTGLSIEELKEKKEQKELELSIGKANLSSLTATINNLRGNLSGFSNKETIISALEQEVQNARDEHLKAISKYNEKKSEVMARGSSIRHLIEAVPAKDPESSKTILLLLLATVASFGFTAFGIVVINLFDMRIRTPKRLKELTKIRVLGSLNEIKIAGSLELNKIFLNNKNQNNASLRFRESLRKIRYEVQQDKSAKRILVTSTKENEGKTFLLLCLAYSISLLDKKILIIDTNFKNNSLTRLLINNHNKSHLLEDKIDNKKMQMIRVEDQGKDTDDSFSNTVIRETGHKNIHIIGSKAGHQSPSELFSGKDFNDMLDRIAVNYDYIFLEGPSLNNYPDSKELLEYVDKLVVVFSANSKLEQADHESIEFMKSLNGKLLGSILNGVDENLQNS